MDSLRKTATLSEQSIHEICTTVHPGPASAIRHAPGVSRFLGLRGLCRTPELGFEERGKVRLSMKVVDQQTGEDLEKKQKEQPEAAAGE
jgi:hypothetical protein